MFSSTLLIGLLFAASQEKGTHLFSPPGKIDASPFLTRAETAFRKGIEARADAAKARRFFAEAADAYAELHNGGVRNPDLYRNLGHAELLAGQLPQAILAYRRGLRLAPQDRRLQQDLEQARDQVGYPQVGPLGRPPASLWPSWSPYLTPGQALLGAVVCYVLGCAAATRWWMVRRRRALALAGATLVLAVLLGACWGWLQWQDWQQEQYPVVVIAADGVVFRTGNGPTYPAHDGVPVLNRGMEARLLFVRADWLQVWLAGGEVGWVPRRQVLLDEPSSVPVVSVVSAAFFSPGQVRNRPLQWGGFSMLPALRKGWG